MQGEDVGHSVAEDVVEGVDNGAASGPFRPTWSPGFGCGVVCAGVALRRDSATGISSRPSSPSSVAQTISVSILTHARSVRSRRACVAGHACCALAGCAQAKGKGD